MTLPKLRIVGRYLSDSAPGGWSGRWYGPPLFPSLTSSFMRVSSGFGPRAPIGTPNGPTPSFHNGVDIGFEDEQGFRATTRPLYVSDVYADGTRLEPRIWRSFRESQSPTAGIQVQVAYYEPADPPLWVPKCILIYAHLAELSQHAVGKVLTPGQLLATGDNTGMSTGPHLHWGLWVPPDPNGFYGPTNPASTGFTANGTGGSNDWHPVDPIPMLVDAPPPPWPPRVPTVFGSQGWGVPEGFGAWLSELANALGTGEARVEPRGSQNSQRLAGEGWIVQEDILWRPR